RLAFADSQYNCGVPYDGPGSEKADRRSRDQYLDWCGRWMRAVVPCLTDDGSFWVLIDDAHAAEYKLLLEAAGLHLHQWLLWYESFGPNNPAGFNQCHRHLF